MLAACGDAKTDNSSSDGSSVNNNEATYTVPDLVGKVADDVSKSADYKDVCAFEIVYEHSSKVEKGKIISQLPVAGETFGEKPLLPLP
ncbi:MAG: PASTA domain-containing protein [Acutalibacteraceae bacterium]|nr:PASTA domain-containing protein [Acutalibacteraceae bacterium]